MPNYLPQEDTKLVTWINQFLKNAKFDIAHLSLKAEELESLENTNAKLAAHQASLYSAAERRFKAQEEYERVRAEYDRAEDEFQTALVTKEEAGVAARQEAYTVVEPLRCNSANIKIKAFLDKLAIPLFDDNGGDSISDVLPRTPEEFTVTPCGSGFNLVCWKANSPPGTNYQIHYAVGSIFLGGSAEPTAWYPTPIIVKHNEYRNGNYIEFLHTTRAWLGAPCWYRVVAQYHETISPSTEIKKVRCW